MRSKSCALRQHSILFHLYPRVSPKSPRPGQRHHSFRRIQGNSRIVTLRKLADVIEAQPNARLPGRNIRTPNEVEVDAELWLAIKELSNK